MTNNTKVIFETTKDQTQFYSKSCLSILALLLLGSFVANAQVTWTGGTSGDWNIASNWSSGMVPGASDKVIISNATINLNGDRTVAGISIVGGGINPGSVSTSKLITNSNTETSFFGGSAIIDVAVEISNATMRLNGATFEKVAIFEIKGIAPNNISSCTGNNTFKQQTTIKATQANNYFILGAGNPDTFVGNLILDSDNGGSIQVGYSSASNQFNQNISMSSEAGGYIAICNGGGSGTLAPSASLVNNGLNGGTLVIGGLDISTPVTFTIPDVIFQTWSGNYFNTVDVSAKGVWLSGSDFHEVTHFTKTGATVDQGQGGNTFHKKVTLTNTANGGFWGFSYSGSKDDVFKDEVYIEGIGSSPYYISTFGSNNIFEKNVYITNTGGAYINFGSSNAGNVSFLTGATILPTLDASSNSLFNTGALYLYRTSMPDPLNLNIPDVILAINTSHFQGAVNATSRMLTLNTSVYDQAATFDIVGIPNSNLYGKGGNTFHGPTSVRFNSTGGSVMMGQTTKDVFKSTLNIEVTQGGIFYLAHSSSEANEYEGDVTFSVLGTGTIRVAEYGQDFSIDNNLTLNSVNPGRIVIGSNSNGKLTLDGTTDQTITHTGTNDYQPAHVFQLDVNKSGGRILLGTNLEIKKTMAFTQGMVKTTGANGLLIFDEDATYTGVDNTKYVSGKVQKKGSVSFVFPVGSDTQYRPLSTNVTAGSAPVTVYFVEGQEPTGIAPPKCTEIATCEHWVVNSDNSVITFNVAVNITGSCVNPLPSNPMIAWFDKTQWNLLDATIQPVDMLTATPTVTTVPNSTQSGDHYVTIGSKITLPGGNVMTGSSSVCQNTSQIYSVPSAPNTTYSWKLPIGWSITSSNPNSNQITVTVASNAPVGTQTIAVYPSQVANCEFCELDPIILEVTVNAQPNVGSVVGPTTAKAGQSSITYSVTNTTGADEFVWTLPTGVAENGSGSTGTITTTVPFITVDFVAGFAGGNINVYGTSTTCGNGPTVSMFVSLCTTCRTSNNALPDNLKNNHLTVFPNPIMGSDKIKIQIEGQTQVSVVNVVIVDEKGAKVKSFVQELQNGIVEIPGQFLAPGKYLLRIQVGAETVGKKLLKY
ncbi:MAG TPA: hypothetical protein DCS93_19640 [Microscillaceae bacterium]|nr:hypothetical protein [Microscillaceae bacterium]